MERLSNQSGMRFNSSKNAVSDLQRGTGAAQLQQVVREMIDRRLATVRAGEAPFRPQVRFLIRPDGQKTYWLAWPALEVLKGSMAYSRAMDVKGRKMIERDFTVQARLSQHLKDVRLILAQAERTGARVPLSEAHRALLERAVELGAADEDNAAVIRAYIDRDDRSPTGL